MSMIGFDPQGSQRPRMYGLPKAHKENIPLTPILSMIGSSQHELAKWLAEILVPVLKLYSSNCVKDAFTFANCIQNCNLEDTFRELMLIATRGVEFIFNNQMYKQLDGVAMGSPLGPALANIFVGFHESRLFDNTAKPGVYSTFGMWMIVLSSLVPSWIVTIFIIN